MLGQQTSFEIKAGKFGSQMASQQFCTWCNMLRENWPWASMLMKKYKAHFTKGKITVVHKASRVNSKDAKLFMVFFNIRRKTR